MERRTQMRNGRVPQTLGLGLSLPCRAWGKEQPQGRAAPVLPLPLPAGQPPACLAKRGDLLVTPRCAGAQVSHPSS